MLLCFIRFDQDAARGPAGGHVDEADGFAFHAADDPMQDGADADPGTYEVDFSRGLIVAGNLHILHNCTNDLKNSLRYWDTFIAMLRMVARMLAKPWSRERLLATCFNEPPHHQHAAAYSGFSSVVYEGRWGEALKAADDLFPLQRSLRAAWSLRKYTYGQVDHPDGGGEGDDRDLETRAVCNTLTYQYSETQFQQSLSAMFICLIDCTQCVVCVLSRFHHGPRRVRGRFCFLLHSRIWRSLSTFQW